jgi:hypothetical protein
MARPLYMMLYAYAEGRTLNYRFAGPRLRSLGKAGGACRIAFLRLLASPPFIPSLSRSKAVT